MNILITGGTGYLAGRLYKHFKKKKYNVKIATRKSKKISKEFSNGDIVSIDWKNIKNLEKICKGVDIILHTAGINSNGSIKNPKKANIVKEKYTFNILSAANKKKVEKFIYISTAHVYSNFLNYKITEKTKTTNTHPYAVSNLKGEKVVLKFTSKKNYTKSYILRLSNAFGKPLNIEVDCWRLFINDICKQSIQNKKIIIYQNHLIKRDFISIYNFVDIIDKFTKLKVSHNKDIIYNVGSGRAYTLIEMAKIISLRVFKKLKFYPDILCKNKDNINKVNFHLDYNISKLLKLKIKNVKYLNKEIDELILFCKKNYG